MSKVTLTLLLLLYSLLISTLADQDYDLKAKVQPRVGLGCFRFASGPVLNPGHCLDALSLIPSGKPTLNHDSFARNWGPDQTPSLLLKGKGALLGPEKVRLPAMFLSETCAIFVEPAWGDRPLPSKGTKMASIMYGYFWPKVREAGLQIIHHCVNVRMQTGYSSARLVVGDLMLPYAVRIEGWHGPIDEPGASTKEPGTGQRDQYNVYTAAGQVKKSGQAWTRKMAAPAGRIHQPYFFSNAIGGWQGPYNQHV